MNHGKLIRRYYESRMETITDSDPPDGLMQSVAAPPTIIGRLSWEDLLGLLITAGYLSQLLLPIHWFSFNRFLFALRFGF